jgi:hypothetical protein
MYDTFVVADEYEKDDNDIFVLPDEVDIGDIGKIGGTQGKSGGKSITVKGYRYTEPEVPKKLGDLRWRCDQTRKHQCKATITCNYVDGKQ